MRFILSLFIIIQTVQVFAQDSIPSKENDLKIIKNFINDLANQEIRTDVILSQHILVNNSSGELYDYLEVSLQEIRINLLSKNLEDILYRSYDQMPPKEVRDIDLENIDSKRVYFLYYKNRQVCAFYLVNDKIASFTLVSKGNNKAHFVLY